jgi:hypothetical protein
MTDELQKRIEENKERAKLLLQQRVAANRAKAIEILEKKRKNQEQ